jgi:hypothetical protein
MVMLRRASAVTTNTSRACFSSYRTVIQALAMTPPQSKLFDESLELGDRLATAILVDHHHFLERRDFDTIRILDFLRAPTSAECNENCS